MLRAALVTLAVVLGLTFIPARETEAQDYDPGVLSVTVVPWITLAEEAIVAIIEMMANDQVLSIQSASASNTAAAEKIVATLSEVARAKEVASAQAQLLQDAARIKELVKLPPLACQTLSATGDLVKADDNARKARAEAMESLEKSALESRNASADASALLTRMAKVKADTVPSASAFLGPKTYSSGEDEAAKVFMKSVTDPVPAERLPEAIEASPNGRAYRMRQVVTQLRLSAAQHSLAEAYAARQQVPTP